MTLPENKNERIAYLIKNKKELIDLKKSVTKFTDDFGANPIEQSVIKEVNLSNEDTDTVIKRTIIGNTYNWMDSHDDVHLSGVFSKSLSERTPLHLHDHVYQLMAKVGRPIQVYEKYVDWTKLGVQKVGQTQALFMDSSIEKELNAQIFKGYLNKEINQHSVGMRYVKIYLAVNDEEYKEEFATWNQHISSIGNRQKAEEQGFFWAVQEAKLIEISCVIEGSNTLTPTLESKLSTEQEPEKSTPPQPLTDYTFLNNLKFV
jgi:hypothetical protein